MNYQIRITKAAEKDLLSAADYIEFSLCNPKAADDLLNKTEEQIQSLSTLPERNAIVDDPVLKAWGIRFIQIGNHLAFYTSSEEQNTVYVVRFLYGKRDWISILRGGFQLQ